MISKNQADISTFIQRLIEERVSIVKKNRIQQITSVFPFALQPIQISLNCYSNMQKASYLWQKLLHQASSDLQFVSKVLESCKDEESIGKLLPILLIKQVFDQQKMKPKLDLCRCDYFLEQSTPKLIQYNVSCVSMAGISSKFQKVYKQINQNKESNKIPTNNSLKIYAKSVCNFYHLNKLKGIFLMVVLSDEININDQNLLIEEIQFLSSSENSQKIQCFKVKYEQFMKQVHLNKDGDLIYKDKNQTAIVYFRAGYNHKHGFKADIKQLIGRSSAISIPSLGSELINTKRMQAELSKETVMGKFLTPQEVEILKSSVIQTWDFDQENSTESYYQQIIKLIQTEGIEKFILKPNLEGGSNNLFGADGYRKLKQLNSSERKNYILTRKLYPQTNICTIIKASNIQDYQASEMKINSQFSIYGAIYSHNGKIITNTVDGFIVRSKPELVNEGGLMAGSGLLSALALTN